MGSEFQKDGSTKIDPDPFALTSMVLAAAAVVLQFITVVQQRPRSNEDTIEPGAARSLMQLEEEVEKLEADLDRLTRTIGRGSDDPDREFYGVSYGVALVSLNLNREAHDAFTSQFSDLCVHVSAVSRWANTLIQHYPETSRTIGTGIMVELAKSSERINALIRAGGHNRELISECRLILLTLKACLSAVNERRRN